MIVQQILLKALRLFLVLFLTLFLISSAYGYDIDLKGKVTSVMDGDTIKVKPSGKSEIKVRITLVNTPEIGQDGYSAAKRYTEEKCLGETAELVYDEPKKDVHGRTLAMTSCDGVNMNAKLIEKGYAEILEEYCDTSRFADENWTDSRC